MPTPLLCVTITDPPTPAQSASSPFIHHGHHVIHFRALNTQGRSQVQIGIRSRQHAEVGQNTQQMHDLRAIWGEGLFALLSSLTSSRAHNRPRPRTSPMIVCRVARGVAVVLSKIRPLLGGIGHAGSSCCRSSRLAKAAAQATACSYEGEQVRQGFALVSVERLRNVLLDKWRRQWAHSHDSNLWPAP